MSIVQQLFPDGKLDLTKKKIDWEIVAASAGINKKAAEMRWARFKKRHMDNGGWISQGGTSGGAASSGDVGEDNDVEEGTPKKRKKNPVTKEVKKAVKESINEGVDDGAEENDK